MSNAAAVERRRCVAYDPSPLTTPLAVTPLTRPSPEYATARRLVSMEEEPARVIAVPFRIVSSIPESGQLVHGSRAQQ
jgi:hypothetical protein